jgi:hypothetical protein
MFKIEKNIEIPETEKFEWPWKEMEIGDCVKFEDEKIMAMAQTRCHVYASKVQKKFMTKKIDNVLHVWRLK